MRSLKNIFIVFTISIISLSTFSSCDDDGYSLGDVYESMATVVPLDDYYYLVLNDGTTLWEATGFGYSPKKKQRAIIYYTILSDKLGEYDHYIKMRAVYEFLTKDIVNLTPENEAEIGNDPIKILAYEIGDDYLNIKFEYKRGGEKAHYINLVNNTMADAPNDGKIHLEFRHSLNGDSQLNSRTGLVAFDLRPYITEGKDSVDLIIKVKDFDGNKEIPITYKFGKNKNENTIGVDDNEITDATLYK